MVAGMTMTLADPARPDTGRAYAVVRFNPVFHRLAAAETLLAVQDDSGTYPPVREAARDRDAFALWLTGEPALGQWVAIAADGRVAGHVKVSVLHPQLGAHLPIMGCSPVAVRGFCEIGRFFVHPDFQGHGVGRELFAAATGYAWDAGHQPALAVPGSALNARRFFAARGLRDAGTFDGLHGPTHVLVDETVPNFTAW